MVRTLLSSQKTAVFFNSARSSIACQYLIPDNFDFAELQMFVKQLHLQG